ncbi:CIR protein [Plasmodium chabaudi chabaudi]|uniref:CIR protein n=1 Tax=Plasmodium chabaudi chabaudi TaxID=31271 RepID=A0A4V6M8W8_PLACU|nr:CIR protein [Plasmodium chabaudi chabaudi]VTZ66941.1 CIR protein [Plasmodium chabaudi chabaudi]|eukprot:XP_016653146.1 CIR protein [Plasmodium chabaudi chabaudi]
MSEELCKAIDEIEDFVVFDSESKKYTFKDKILEAYCSLSGKGENGQCDTESLKLSSGFMGLLEYFKSIEDENLDDDKRAQYAILWFSYKIRQNANIEIEKNTMYDILRQNGWLSEHIESIEKIKDIMGIHFEYLNRLYRFLKGICETITNCNDPSKTSDCQESAKKCSELYRACIVQLPWREICNPYCSVLTNLKNDYDKFRKNNSDKDIPELELTEGLSECNVECSKQEKRHKGGGAAQNRSSDGSEIDTFTNASLPGPSVPTTSINNGNKIPYIAIPFILIPIILGISYKYLTPVWRKKSKRKAMKKIINLSDQKKA